MITTDDLSVQVSKRLTNVRPIVPGVIRGEKTGTGGNPYAVYFFALSNDLNEWASHLEDKQDEVIGPSYFESPNDLRWNHYLYLLTSKEVASQESFKEIKRDIESNPSYARKFVLSEDELPEVLKQLEPSKTIQRDIASPDVVSRWTERLMSENLEIVLNQRPIAETIREISAGTAVVRTHEAGNKTTPRLDQPLATRFLDSLELVRFRKWPKHQTYGALGTVNLIVGGNGTGKTTLLEAIEYLYCAGNARTLSPPKAHVKAHLMGMANPIETRSIDKSAEAKQRNLDWYGQRDLKGSTLQNSFARFNFLSTDEATLLGQKDAKLSFDDMLSRVVSGPQAAELWDHISRLVQPLDAEYSRLRSIIMEAEQSKASLEKFIKATTTAPRASDSAFSALREDLARLEWRASISRDTVGTECVPALARVSSIARELMAGKLRLAHLSQYAVFKSLYDAEGIAVKVSLGLEQISTLKIGLKSADVEKQNLQHLIHRIKSIKAAQQIGAFELISEYDRLQQLSSEHLALVGAEVLPLDAPEWMPTLLEPLTDSLSLSISNLSGLSANIASLESQLTQLKISQTSITTMLAEIRSLTRQLLVHSPNHTQCPVCTSKYEIGKLGDRLAQAEAQAIEDHTGPILSALIESRNKKNIAEQIYTILSSLHSYSRRREHDTLQLTPQEVFLDYCAQRQESERGAVHLGEIEERISNLSNFGITLEAVRELQQLADQMGIDVLRQGEVDEKLSSKSKELDEMEENISRCLAEIERLDFNLSSAMRGVDIHTEQLDEIVKEFKDRLQLLRNANTLIGEIQKYMRLGNDINIALVAPLIESTRVSAERFAKAHESEKTTQVNEAAAKKQMAQVEAQIVQHTEAIKRVKHAKNILGLLIKEDSLLAATEEELMDMQEATDAVFRRIHLPNEYAVRRDLHAPLYRLDDTQKAVTLRDVSTGQRAAFVLSIFLAMNAKLRSAPPVLLFDDPVAHIDDFNALSFLDHLRDVALEGKRQIFYATADTRLAGLFEHKFSFLGEKFKRFDLER